LDTDGAHRSLRNHFAGAFKCAFPPSAFGAPPFVLGFEPAGLTAVPPGSVLAGGVAPVVFGPGIAFGSTIAAPSFAGVPDLAGGGDLGIDLFVPQAKQENKPGFGGLDLGGVVPGANVPCCPADFGGFVPSTAFIPPADFGAVFGSFELAAGMLAAAGELCRSLKIS